MGLPTPYADTPPAFHLDARSRTTGLIRTNQPRPQAGDASGSASTGNPAPDPAEQRPARRGDGILKVWTFAHGR